MDFSQDTNSNRNTKKEISSNKTLSSLEYDYINTEEIDDGKLGNENNKSQSLNSNKNFNDIHNSSIKCDTSYQSSSNTNTYYGYSPIALRSISSISSLSPDTINNTTSLTPTLNRHVSFDDDHQKTIDSFDKTDCSEYRDPSQQNNRTKKYLKKNNLGKTLGMYTVKNSETEVASSNLSFIIDILSNPYTGSIAVIAGIIFIAGLLMLGFAIGSPHAVAIIVGASLSISSVKVLGGFAIGASIAIAGGILFFHEPRKYPSNQISDNEYNYLKQDKM